MLACILQRLLRRFRRVSLRTLVFLALQSLSVLFLFPLESQAAWNIPLKTMGGKQLWADERICGGWRVQRHIATGHYRLLDPDDIRRTWGTYETCVRSFERLKASGKITQASGDVVIVLHGLWRAKEAMGKMACALQDEGYEVVNANYPSVFGSIEEHAEWLDRLVRNLDDPKSISFVCHSTGGMVVRRWCDVHPDARLHRVVMMGTPNHGTGLADFFDMIHLLRPIFGPAAMQMRTLSHGGITESYGTPPCEIGIIAGGNGKPGGYNPIMQLDNDSIVEVENTKLDGMKAFLQVKRRHTFIMSAPEVIAAVKTFLKTGSFLPTP